jgi:hypothetical protein
MANFLNEALSQGTNMLNQGTNVLSQGTNALSQGTNALSQGTEALSSKIPGLGKGLSAVNTISSAAAALTDGETKEDIIKGVALILEDKITNILEEKITKSLEEKITEKVEVKVIQKLEEITKTVNDAIKTGANANETKVGGRKSRKQKKNKITRKRRTNQKSFSQAFRRTQGRKRNFQ